METQWVISSYPLHLAHSCYLRAMRTNGYESGMVDLGNFPQKEKKKEKKKDYLLTAHYVRWHVGKQRRLITADYLN